MSENRSILNRWLTTQRGAPVEKGWVDIEVIEFAQHFATQILKEATEDRIWALVEIAIESDGMCLSDMGGPNDVLAIGGATRLLEGFRDKLIKRVEG